MKIDLKYIIVFAIFLMGLSFGMEVFEQFKNSQNRINEEKRLKKEENKSKAIGFYFNCIDDDKPKICCTMLKQSYWEFLNNGFVSDETKQLTERACGLTVVKDIKQESGIIEGVKTGPDIYDGNYITK